MINRDTHGEWRGITSILPECCLESTQGRRDHSVFCKRGQEGERSAKERERERDVLHAACPSHSFRQPKVSGTHQLSTCSNFWWDSLRRTSKGSVDILCLEDEADQRCQDEDQEIYRNRCHPSGDHLLSDLYHGWPTSP